MFLATPSCYRHPVDISDPRLKAPVHWHRPERRRPPRCRASWGVAPDRAIGGSDRRDGRRECRRHSRRVLRGGRVERAGDDRSRPHLSWSSHSDARRHPAIASAPEAVSAAVLRHHSASPRRARGRELHQPPSRHQAARYRLPRYRPQPAALFFDRRIVWRSTLRCRARQRRGPRRAPGEGDDDRTVSLCDSRTADSATRFRSISRGRRTWGQRT